MLYCYWQKTTTNKKCSCFLTSTVSHGAGGAGWQQHADVLPSQTARCQTLDRGLRPGPELFWETKNGAEIPTQDRRSAWDCGVAPIMPTWSWKCHTIRIYNIAHSGDISCIYAWWKKYWCIWSISGISCHVNAASGPAKQPAVQLMPGLSRLHTAQSADTSLIINKEIVYWYQTLTVLSRFNAGEKAPRSSIKIKTRHMATNRCSYQRPLATW